MKVVRIAVGFIGILLTLSSYGTNILIHNDAPPVSITVCYGKGPCTKLNVVPTNGISQPIKVEQDIAITVSAPRLKSVTFGIAELNRNRGGLEYHIVAKKGRLVFEIHAPANFFD